MKASDNCGIFVKFKNRNLVKHFLENIQKEDSNQNGSNVFKSHTWFIFTEDMENLKLKFRFDSKVYLITNVTETSATFYETYSIGGMSTVTQQIGEWTKDRGLGRLGYFPIFQNVLFLFA